MDRKFFFFRREPESETSTSFSDTGVGLSTIAIPSENLTFITAGKKKVVFTFKDCNGFDESVLQEGESIPKANITVACKEGDEAGLIEDVINFMSRDTAKNIMKFDVVEGKSTFDKAVVDTVDDVRSVIPSAPVNTITKEISVGDEAKKFQQTIAGITFPNDIPSVDYNHEGIAQYANGASINAGWSNAGTEGSAYVLSAFAGTCNAVTDAGESTLIKKAATIGSTDGLRTAADFFATETDYTIYVAFNTNGIATSTSYGIGAIYADNEGETFGFGGRPQSDGVVSASNSNFQNSRNVFAVRHDGLTGYPAFTSTLDSSDGTKSFEIPDSNVTAIDYNPNNVFIVRRDKQFNMFLHNRDGDIIAKLPANTKFLDPSLISSSPGRTDGTLKFRNLGRSNGTSISGKIYLNRFGIITKDIGANDAANLAKQLHQLYAEK
tara:strand:- start:804 stop:2114 length:1311 start_codon:yes stop_codon:yes gene_type:complete